MSLKLFYTLILIVSTLTVSVTQQIQVVDKSSENPLGFVLISQMGETSFEMTEEDGSATLSKLNSEYPYVFSLLGYDTDTLTILDIQSQNGIVKLVKSAFIIDQIIVSTSRWRQNNGTSPARISTIRSSNIAVNNPQTSADLLGSSGEIFIQKSQQGGGSPIIRGFSANRLLYAVDGIRMNTAIFRSGNLQNVISIDPYSISNTDIIFGPGSVSYGSDAIGGVMSFNTKQPTVSDKGYDININQRFSSANNEFTSHADISYGSNKLSGLTSLTFNKYGNLKMGSNGGFKAYENPFFVKREDSVDVVCENPNPLIQKNTSFNQYHLMQKVKYHPNRFTAYHLGLHYSTTSEYGRYDRLIRFDNGFPRSAEWYYGPQSWLLANLQIHNTKPSRIYDKTILRVAYQNFKESRNERNFNSPNLNTRSENVNAYSINYDLLKKLSTNFELGYGIEGVYNKVLSQGNLLNIIDNTSNQINARYPNSDWYSAALFANLSKKLSERIIVSGGIRINQYGLYSKFDTSLFNLPFETAELSDLGFSGSFGTSYRPSDLTYISINLSSGFRAPNIDDLGKIFDSAPGNVVVPNPNLKSEKALNFELSVSQVLFDKLRLDLTGYYINLKDGMLRRDFAFNGLDSIFYDEELSKVQATINAAKINVLGIQAGFELNFTPSLSIYGRINLQNGDEELDDGTISPSRHAAPYFGLMRINKTIRDFTIILGTHFSGGFRNDQLPVTELEKAYLYAQDENDRPFSPSWKILNFTAKYKISNNTNFVFKLENLFDKQYRPYSSGLAGSGRNFIFNANFKF